MGNNLKFWISQIEQHSSCYMYVFKDDQQKDIMFIKWLWEKTTTEDGDENSTKIGINP